MNNKISILVITIFAIASGFVSANIKDNQNNTLKFKKNKNYSNVKTLVKIITRFFLYKL
jgi:peptidoglycan hydrolase CwlO-like protein